MPSITRPALPLQRSSWTSFATRSAPSPATEASSYKLHVTIIAPHALTVLTSHATLQAEEGLMAPTRYRTADVDGFKVFYREAGQADAPKLLLLHGFPSAGHMFRDLIPRLADRFHIVAPDLPGFGQSDMPPREQF